MKNIFLLGFGLFCAVGMMHSQQINPSDLVGTWAQSEGKPPATMQFVDDSKVRYSYKGHTGSTRDFYYLLNTSNNPAVLTVDYSIKHKKHRNEYLVQLMDKDTLKIQVLYKKDSREHFADESKNKPVILIRQKAG